MKKILLLAITAAGVLASAETSLAADATMSPRGKALADSLKKVPATTTDMLVRSIGSGSPKAIVWTESLRRVPGMGSSIDLAHGPRPTLSPKDPRYAEEWRRLHEIQIAPLK